jgi:hypothetical protein
MRDSARAIEVITIQMKYLSCHGDFTIGDLWFGEIQIRITQHISLLILKCPAGVEIRGIFTMIHLNSWLPVATSPPWTQL